MGDESPTPQTKADLAAELAAAHDRLASLEARAVEAESRLQLAMDVGRLAWWEWDVSTGEVHGSPGKAGLLGYGLDEGPFDVDWWIAAIHPEEREYACDVMRAVLAGERLFYELDYRLRRKDGRWQWFHDRGRITRRSADGEPLAIGGVVHDLSARRELENALRRRTADLEAAQRVAGVGSWSYDLRRHRVAWSPQMYELLRHDARLRPVPVRRLRAMLRPEDRPVWEHALRRLKETGGFELEFRLPMDGRERTFHTLARGEMDERGLARIYGTLQDITARKQTEDALVESRRFLSAVFDAIDDGICVSDLNLRIRQTNRKLRAWFMDALPLEGKRSCDVLHIGCWADEPCPGQRALASGRPAQEELRLTDGQGKERWYLVHAFPVWDPSGSLRGAVEYMRDITASKRDAEQRRRLEQRVQRTQKYESLAALAGGIAHDFNNLLMTILGSAELAADDVGANHPAAENIQSIVEAAMRAGELSQQVMLYAGQRRAYVAPVRLPALVDEVAPVLRASIPRRHALRLDTGEPCPPAELDAQQIRQVLLNLVINASEALGEAEGGIVVRTGFLFCDAAYLNAASMDGDLPEGVYTYVEVADEGEGIAAEALGRVFDPFFSTRAPGRGLGLAAVAGIVRAHRGAVAVHSRPGRGTTVRVLFPAREDAESPGG